RRAAGRAPSRPEVVFARVPTQAAALTPPGTRGRVAPTLVAPDQAPGDQAIRCVWRKPCSQSGH
ncbi:TOP6B-like family protein, partial [Erwinia amylovora]|uniref:TOP6B-like family protein n=1 Tax=Erwinia amylovora TaxID=552 RepID=UPI0020C13302